MTASTCSSLTGVSGAITAAAPNAPSALDNPSSVPPLIAADVPTLHADSTTTSGIDVARSRSYTVSGPSARASVENSGLSVRNVPWQARCTSPRARRTARWCPSALELAAGDDDGAVVDPGQRGDLLVGEPQARPGDRARPAPRDPGRRRARRRRPRAQRRAHRDRAAAAAAPARPTARRAARRSGRRPADGRRGRRSAAAAGRPAPPPPRSSSSPAAVTRRRRPLHAVQAVQGERAHLEVVVEGGRRAEVVERATTAAHDDRVEVAGEVGVGDEVALAEGGDRLGDRVLGGRRLAALATGPTGEVADLPLDAQPLAIGVAAGVGTGVGIDGRRARAAQLGEQRRHRRVVRRPHERRPPHHRAHRLDAVEELARPAVLDGQRGAELDQLGAVVGGVGAGLQRARARPARPPPPAARR